jgi:transcriptional regulator with XRE-family HTH domain
MSLKCAPQLHEDGESMNALQAHLARAALRKTYAEAAELCDVSITTIQRVEAGDPTVQPRTLRRMRRAFEDAGIEFIDGDSIRLRAPK